MANELPYFRFVVQAWQNGKIDIERYELKGFFISLCGYYWIQDCSITLALLQKKFSNDTILINELIELKIIKHEKRHDKIEIDFLNIQFDLLSEKRKARRDAGSKGGNAKAMLKQKSSYKDKDKDKDKDNVTIDFLEFWNLYPVKVSRVKCESKWKKLKLDDQQKIIETLPGFIKFKPFEKYNHPNPETYLNQKRWIDEIPETKLNDSKKEYTLKSPEGNILKVFLTQNEIEEKTKTGYWKLC